MAAIFFALLAILFASVRAFTEKADCPLGATLISTSGGTTVCKFNSAACPAGWTRRASGQSSGLHCSQSSVLVAPAVKPTPSQITVFREVSCEDVVGQFDVLAQINGPNVKSNMESVLRFACEQSNKSDGDSLDCEAHAKLAPVMNAFVDKLKTCSGVAKVPDPDTLSSPTNKNTDASERALISKEFVTNSAIDAHVKMELQAGCSERWYGCTNTLSCLRSCGRAIRSCATAISFGGLNFAADYYCIRDGLGCFRNMGNCCGCAAYYGVISCSTCGRRSENENENEQRALASNAAADGPPPTQALPSPPPPDTPCTNDYVCSKAGEYLAAGCNYCTTCPPGTASQGIKNSYLGCAPCTSGKYSTGGASQCSTCPSGKTSSNTASSCYTISGPPPPPRQAPCYNSYNCGDNNSYLNQGCKECLACVPGTASYGIKNNFLTCKLCPVNFYAKTYSSATCTACPAGKSTRGRLGATECSDGATPPPPPPVSLTPSKTWVGGKKTYECMAYEVYPAPESGAPECVLTCPSNTQKITISSAWWGNSWTGTYPDVTVTQACGTQVKDKVTSLCNGKKSGCRVEASVNNLGEPCLNKEKVLFVDYSCK